MPLKGSQTDRAVVRAPASIGNVAVGFDMMGMAFAVAYDTVTARRLDPSSNPAMAPGSVRLGAVGGLVTSLPDDAARNTALRAGQAVLKKAMQTGPVDWSAALDIDKGVPLSAGMGGSAASAVAATLAVNALLPVSLSDADLLACAIEGEAASADPPPLDNVVASLKGGLVLICGDAAQDLIALPTPEWIVCVLFHPDLRVETQAARTLLKDSVPLSTAIAHARHVAAFVAACHRQDSGLIARSMRDCLVEPQRVPLVPVLPAVQEAAFAEGALGCSLSGSGPSIFAWVPEASAERAIAAMAAVLDGQGLGYRLHRAPLGSPGAEVLDPGLAREV